MGIHRASYPVHRSCLPCDATLSICSTLFRERVGCLKAWRGGLTKSSAAGIAGRQAARPSFLGSTRIPSHDTDSKLLPRYNTRRQRIFPTWIKLHIKTRNEQPQTSASCRAKSCRRLGAHLSPKGTLIWGSNKPMSA